MSLSQDLTVDNYTPRETEDIPSAAPSEPEPVVARVEHLDLQRLSRDKKALYADRDRRPKMLSPAWGQIPPALRALNQWVAWNLQWDDARSCWTKIPLDVRSVSTSEGYGKAKSDTPATWLSLDRVRAGWDKTYGTYTPPNPDGPGFVFKAGGGITGFDIDKCRDPVTGELSLFAQRVVEDLPTYYEVSPSLLGIKGFFLDSLPDSWNGKGRRVTLGDGQEIECYDRGRFFAVTGHVLECCLADLISCGSRLYSFLAEYFPPEKQKPQRKATANGVSATLSDERVIAKITRTSTNAAEGARLWAGDISGHGDDHSRADLALMNLLAFYTGGDRGQMNRLFQQSGLMRDKWDEQRGAQTYAEITIDKALAGRSDFYERRQKTRKSIGNTQPQFATETPAPAGKSYPPPLEGEAWNDPHRLARLFSDGRRTARREPTLMQWRDEFHAWDGAAWRPVSDSDLDAQIAEHCRAVFEADYPFRVLGAAERAEEQGKENPDPVTLYPVTLPVKGNTKLNLSGLLNYPDTGCDPPFWLGETHSGHNAAEVIAAPNGLFVLSDIATGSGPFSAPTPRFFTPNAIGFPVPDNAPLPTTWLRCLDQWFSGDAGCILGLQEWVGYMLSADTSAHKVLMLPGPPRSGKGTVLYVLGELLGAGNIASTSFSALGESFGLQDLLGKRVASIPDARLSGRTDLAAVVERLLSISGEDVQTVNRKNKPRITAKLRVRFVIATNEIPRLPDASGALASRFHILPMSTSFLGKEDKTLKEKLRAELPGILVWAARGWVRLRKQGMTFTPNDRAKEHQRELEDLSSPVKAFVRQCCVIGPECEVEIPVLYEAWRTWNEERKREVGSEGMFGRELRAVLPHIRSFQTKRVGERRKRMYAGVKPKPRDDWGEDDA